MEKRKRIRLLCVFMVVGCRCALCSGARWFFSEIWKLLAISKSPAAFCSVFQLCPIVSGTYLVYLWLLMVFFEFSGNLCGVLRCFRQVMVVFGNFSAFLVVTSSFRHVCWRRQPCLVAGALCLLFGIRLS
jgi:hypothetical protein